MKDILCIVRPFQFYVATGQIGPGYGHDFRLSGIQPADIIERGGRFDEIALLELGFPHEQPGVPQEWVELLTGHIRFFLGRFPLVDVRFRPRLYGVQLDGFLAFFDGGLEVGLSHGCRRFISHGIHGQ